MAVHLRRHLGPGLTAGLVLALAGCGAARTATEPVPGTAAAPWVSPVLRDHALAGRIWMPAEARFIAPAAAAALVAGARFVLIGEQHNNVDHKRIQAWLVRRLAQRRPAVAFEAVDATQARKIAVWLERHPGSVAGVGAAAGWSKGWLPWEHYAPIAQAVIGTGGPVLAASLDRPQVGRIYREGLRALPENERRSLGLDENLPPDLRRVLYEAIRLGHCNLLPEASLRAMVAVQRVKDAVMARALVRGAALSGRDGAVLIAGNGHVRRDLGAPWHLRRLSGGKGRIVTVGIVEVVRGLDRPGDYAGSFGVAELPFDLVWFTPRVDEDDPCVKNAAQLRKSREREMKGQR